MAIDFSIILTSYNRKKELMRFIHSINGQENFDLSLLQIIFVDQEENAEIFSSLDGNVDSKYIKYHKCSLSEARNVALPHVKNNYICFGDDDAWYDKDTFYTISSFIKKGYDGVFGVVKNESNCPLNVFPFTARKLTYANHCGAMSASMFIKFDKTLFFDESIGVGSPYNLGSGEETDYLLSYMENHPAFNFYFTPQIVVRHPVQNQLDKGMYLKVYSYARGTGFVLRKHRSLPLMFKLRILYRPLVGMILYFFVNRMKSRKSYFIFKGRLEGYFYKL